MFMIKSVTFALKSTLLTCSAAIIVLESTKMLIDKSEQVIELFTPYISICCLDGKKIANMRKLEVVNGNISKYTGAEKM